MAAITLKDIPTPLYRSLKARARRHKRSLNKEVIALLEEAVATTRRVHVETRLADIARLREELHFTVTDEEIHAYKNEGRA